MTICRGVFSDTAYREWVGSSEYEVIAGELEGAHPGFPVVLGWQSDCVSEVPATTTQVSLSDSLSLEEINKARHLEIAVTGASYSNCFDFKVASALADEAAQQLGDDWLRVEFVAVEPDLTDYCYQPVIDLQWGAVWMGGADLPRTDELATSSTLPPVFNR